MNTKKLFEEEIAEAMEELKKTEVGTDEYKAKVDVITKLTDKLIELEKLDIEAEKNQANYEIECDKNTLEKEKAEHEKKDGKIKNWLTALGIGVPAGMAVWGTLTTIKFEQTGTMTYTAGKQFINKLFKK